MDVDESKLDETARQIVERNRKAREASTNRMERLTDALTTGTEDEFSGTARDILDESIQGGELFRPSGEAQPTNGSDWESTDAVGGSATPEEPGS